jgi:hypothetical protein
MATIENKKGYAYFEGKPSKIYKRHTIVVTYIADQVPGAFHDRMDLPKWLVANMPYIEKIEIPE